MNDSRFAVKVGMFVLGGAVLVALLILNFSNGPTLFTSTYKLRVVLPNAAGLKPSADVMMAGVSIGKVSEMELAENDRSVDITVNILSRYKIRKDAKVHIDSLGFLGDQYVEVSVPTDMQLAPTNEIAYWQPGDTVPGEPVFNMTEAVKSISGVVDQARKTMKDLDQAITNVNNSALSPATLARFVVSVSNLEVVTERVAGAASRAESLLSTNAPAFNSAVGNFQALSARLTNTAGEVDQMIVTNQDDVRRFVTNLTEASDNFKKFSQELQVGKGPMNTLLKDEKMSAELENIVSNANRVTVELSIFGSNLNERGIWAMLWKPKQKKAGLPPPHQQPAARWRNQ
jgi:phospholipid/cholesterol/gamma-HCH transport system substrate-binding protein